MELDAGEGADILMVKPAITSRDLLARARDRRAVLETLTAIVRAGAGIVITYFAIDAATWLREGR